MTSFVRTIGVGVALTMFIVGCARSPQVAPDHRRIVEGLMTATSAEDPDWLERNASLIEDLRRNGKLSDSEDRAFSAIIEAGRSGHWQQAREQAFALGRAQRATNEDRKKTELRTITKDG